MNDRLEGNSAYLGHWGTIRVWAKEDSSLDWGSNSGSNDKGLCGCVGSGW